MVKDHDNSDQNGRSFKTRITKTGSILIIKSQKTIICRAILQRHYIKTMQHMHLQGWLSRDDDQDISCSRTWMPCFKHTHKNKYKKVKHIIIKSNAAYIVNILQHDIVPSNKSNAYREKPAIHDTTCNKEDFVRTQSRRISRKSNILSIWSVQI